LQIHSRPGSSGSSAPDKSRAVPCANSNAPTPCVHKGEHAIHLVQPVEQSAAGIRVAEKRVMFS
jgi:hypothetical protein